MRTNLSAVEEQAVLLAYSGGATCREIGRQIGRSKTSVANVLRRNQVDQRRGRDMAGPKNPHWKGGTYRDSDGYVHQWTPDGHRAQHRLVADATPSTTPAPQDGQAGDR